MTQYDKIMNLAIGNHGLVTAAQARMLGVRIKDMMEWVQLGRLEKCWRGVYRITCYLPSEYDRYAEALALIGEEAVIWGESVLAMLNLALVNPRHITVASGKRVRRNLPNWVCIVRLPNDSKLDFYNGIRCQNLMDVILEAKGKVMTERLVAAIHDAVHRELLGACEIKKLKEEFKI